MTRSRSRRLSSTPSYRSDVYGWAIDQARHIRARRYDLLDLAHVADEIEDVARREFESLVSNLVITLQHMLKWDHQAERRSRSWALSIAEHRDRIADTLEDSPSLASRQDDALVRAYRRARKTAASETDLPLSAFPEASPYTWADVTVRPFTLTTD